LIPLASRQSFIFVVSNSCSPGNPPLTGHSVSRSSPMIPGTVTSDEPATGARISSNTLRPSSTPQMIGPLRASCKNASRTLLSPCPIRTLSSPRPRTPQRFAAAPIDADLPVRGPPTDPGPCCAPTTPASVFAELLSFHLLFSSL